MQDNQEARLELYGTHGTTRSRARKILASKCFVAGQRAGRAGPGSYFWAFDQTPNIALSLARQWWEHSRAKNWYRADINKDCSIVQVKFDLPTADFFDATTLEFQEGLFETAREQECETIEDLCNLYHWAIEDLETTLGKKFGLIMAMVSSPKGDGARTLVNLLYSMSRCYVLRHDRNDLIASIEEVPEN